MALVSYSDTNLPTVNEIRTKWCFGLPLAKDTGDPMPDEDIQLYIDGAIHEMERRLGVYLKPTKIMCSPEVTALSDGTIVSSGLVQGVDYDVAEVPYDYDVRAYRAWGFLQLRERPVIPGSITRLQLVLPNLLPIIDFCTRPEWIKPYYKQGQIHIVPYAGDPTLFAILGGSQTGYPFITGNLNTNIPAMFYVDYSAGTGEWKDIVQKDADGTPIVDNNGVEVTKRVWCVPPDIRNVVGKMAAIDVLGIASEAFSAGVASQSTSIDGLSESISLTASAENIIYGAHILQYKKEVDAFFSPKGAAARTTERGITMTVL